MIRAISLAGVLAVLWLLLSGYVHEPLLLGLGAVSVAGVAFIARRMDVIDHEGHPIQLSSRALLYWPWLLKEIVLANIDVAKVLIRWRMPLDIAVFNVKASQRSELGRVVYANSITLTPGTVTLALDDDILTVYALTTGAAEGVNSGEMDRRVSALEGNSRCSPPQPSPSCW
ncbi:MAG: Na+/H+ antiporter subunit E [Rhodospirillales bacterium]